MAIGKAEPITRGKVFLYTVNVYKPNMPKGRTVEGINAHRETRFEQAALFYTIRL
jgi:hypothetical protein